MRPCKNKFWMLWVLIWLLLMSESSVAQRIHLLGEASVSNDSVRLSDLLPRDLPPEVRQAAEQVDLGRAPLCHTVRFLDPSEIERALSSSPALKEISFVGQVAVRRTCFVILRLAIQQIVDHFAQSNHLQLGHLPSQLPEIYTRQKNPALEIAEAIPMPARSELQLRLRCVEETACSSFWIAVPAAEPTQFVASPKVIRKSLATRFLLQRGEPAILSFDAQGIHMQLPVVCLERGTLGALIRVRDQATRRVFQAEVTGPGTLKAEM